VAAALGAERLRDPVAGLPGAHVLLAAHDPEALGGHHRVDRPERAAPALTALAVAVARRHEGRGDLERHRAAGAASRQGSIGRMHRPRRLLSRCCEMVPRWRSASV
jgi:hypothetical protein